MKHKTFHFTKENTKFFGQYWEAENPKANLILVHGMGEHSSRYGGFFAHTFNEAGYSIIAFDHYGHGETKGKRGDCPSYDAVLNSVAHVVKKTDDYLDASLPKIIYGHSMGGNVVANYILKKNLKTIKAAVLSSPMLKLAFDPPAWKLAAGKIMRNIYPSFQEKTGLDAKGISRDSDEVEKYKNDPLVHDKITINFSLPFFEAGDWALENANKLDVPTLLIHGTGDQITSAAGSENFAKKAGEKASLKLYEGGFHELHNDLDKDDVLNDVINWLDQTIQ